MVILIHPCPKEITIFVITVKDGVCDQKCPDKLCESHPLRHPDKTNKKKKH